MEINPESVLEIWEVFCEHLPPAKREQLAFRFVKIFIDQDIELSDLDDIRGEDEYLDDAFDKLEDRDNNDYEEELEDED